MSAIHMEHPRKFLRRDLPDSSKEKFTFVILEDGEQNEEEIFSLDLGIAYFDFHLPADIRSYGYQDP